MSKFKNKEQLELYLSSKLKSPSPELIRRIVEYHHFVQTDDTPSRYKSDSASRYKSDSKFLLSLKDILEIEVSTSMMYEGYTSCNIRLSLFIEECVNQESDLLKEEFGTSLLIHLLLEEIGFECEG